MTGAERQHCVDSPLACYYAGAPALRPRCTLTATVRLGAVVLCAPCNAARSTLGKANAQSRYQQAGSSTSWAGLPPPTNKHVPPTRTWLPLSPEPTRPGHPGPRSEPSSASHAKAHNNALRAHPYMSQRSRLRAHPLMSQRIGLRAHIDMSQQGPRVDSPRLRG